MSMLSIDFLIILPKRIKRNQLAVAWFFAPNSPMTMVLWKHYKSVQIPSYAVSADYILLNYFKFFPILIRFFLCAAQPPGVPEICKKSLNSCPADGGLELFIIGKNFLKDTHVIFQETYETNMPSGADETSGHHQQLIGGPLWEQTVIPDKEYLQQVCN